MIQKKQYVYVLVLTHKRGGGTSVASAHRSGDGAEVAKTLYPEDSYRKEVVKLEVED